MGEFFFISGPTPMLSPQLETPQQLCSSGRLPARCLQPGAPDSSSLSCHWSLRRGMRVLAQSLSESSPSLACRGPLVTMPFLSVFSDSFPKKESWRIIIVTLAHPVCVGGETSAAHLCLEPGRAGNAAKSGRHREADPLQKELCVLVLLLFRLS